MPRAFVLDLSHSEGFGGSIVKTLASMHATVILSGEHKEYALKEAMAEASVIVAAIDASTNAQAIQDFLAYIDHHRGLADSSLQLNIVHPDDDPRTDYPQGYLSFTIFTEKYKAQLRQAELYSSSHMTQASSRVQRLHYDAIKGNPALGQNS